MAVSDPLAVIQATLAPMFLVSGASIFLNFLQARLFRISDRLRALVADAKALPMEDPRRAQELEHVAVLARRQRIVRNAIVAGVVTVALTALTAILLIGPALLGLGSPGDLTVIVFSLALLSFAGALVLGLRDTLLSVTMTEIEVAELRAGGR